MDDLATKVYTAGNVPASETDAIVIKDIDIDSTSVVSVGGNTQATLYIKFTKGTLTNCTIKLYGSYVGDPTAGDWYTETEEASSSGVLTLNPISIVLTGDLEAMWHFPIGACRAYKVTVSNTGTVTTGALSLAVALRSN